MKIFCTGNIKKNTVAYGLQKIYPKTKTASLSTGWNFTNPDDVERLKKEIINYNIFVNSAYIDKDVQMLLTDTVLEQWKMQGIKGHIFNIGTTLENTGDESEYAVAKRRLRKHSVQLSEATGISGVKVSYLVIGGINNKSPENHTYVMPTHVAETIIWAAKQKFRLPLIQIESQKTF